ncbi:hypothetical protein [Streptomyces sp. 769]|uniref:hypothetical protein n=1 Tax=Streptomyces sp. 769 TaxID=1262452 RepID=UPI00099BC5E5|nr:hypothetical protein [Streptomyces sp. 769]
MPVMSVCPTAARASGQYGREFAGGALDHGVVFALVEQGSHGPRSGETEASGDEDRCLSVVGRGVFAFMPSGVPGLSR